MSKDDRYSIEGSIASVFFLILICVVVLQVTGRFGIFVAPVWTEELARWIWVWMALLALGEVERTNGHLRMEFLISFTSAGFRKLLFTVVDVVYLAVVCHLTWIGGKTVLRTWNNSSVTLPMTDAFLYASYVPAALFVIWRIVLRLRSSRRSSQEAVP